MAKLRTTVATMVAEQRLFVGVRKLVVGVSGGADSVALLDWLVTFGPAELELVVAHLHHGLRGAAADEDERFVVALAAGYGVPVRIGRVAVRELAATSGASLEEAGRVARYNFLFEVCDQSSADAVAVAHHAADQAETILLRLLRGAGSQGLAAMQTRSPDGRLLRPFLNVDRPQILAYLQDRGLAWREDASNQDLSHTRNRIRHELLPLLHTYNPAIAERLRTTGRLLADEDAAMAAWSQAEYNRLARSTDGGVSFAVVDLVALPPALQRRLLRLAIARVQGSCRHLSFDHLQQLLALARPGAPNRTVCLPGGCQAVRSYGDLVIGHSHQRPVFYPFPIPGVGIYALADGRQLRVVAGAAVAPLPEGSDWVSLRAAAVPFPWLIRPWRAGDRFVPSGMTGHQKLQDFFTNRKVPRQERLLVPLLESAGRIVWLIGYRLAAGVVWPGGEDSGPWVAVQLVPAPRCGLPEGA